MGAEHHVALGAPQRVPGGGIGFSANAGVQLACPASPVSHGEVCVVHGFPSASSSAFGGVLAGVLGGIRTGAFDGIGAVDLDDEGAVADAYPDAGALGVAEAALAVDDPGGDTDKVSRSCLDALGAAGPVLHPQPAGELVAVGHVVGVDMPVGPLARLVARLADPDLLVGVVCVMVVGEGLPADHPR